MTNALEFRRLDATLAEALGVFFGVLREANAEEHFHPHPLTVDEARKLAAYGGADLYYVATDGGAVVAYGMLRGWDEGYEVPSLGIAVHPARQGSGLGRAFMHFLHAAARARGAKRIRLTVETANDRACRLYRDLGYELTPDGHRFVGFLNFS